MLNADTIYTSLSDNERTKYLLRADNKVTSKIIGTYYLFKVSKRKRESQFTNVISATSFPINCRVIW